MVDVSIRSETFRAEIELERDELLILRAEHMPEFTSARG
jgi:hypothetical protein